MKQFVKRNRVASSIIVICLVLAGVSVWGWWHYVYAKPERVFNRMLSISLSTPSVTKQTLDPSSDQNLMQTTELSVNPSASMRSVSTVQQAGSTIKTESIATPLADYIRYADIQTSQKSKSGNPLDFSHILGVWGKSSSQDPASSGAQLFNQTTLGVIPIARLAPADKQALLRQMKNENVYSVDYNTVKRTIVDGRPVYVYKVGLKPRAYVNMLKSFSRYLGNDELASVNTTEYPESPLLTVEVTVDVWSSQLQKIAYTDSQRTETYQSHGAYNNIQEPTNSISLEELQSKLQQVQ